MDAELGKQPTPDECADDPKKEITDEAESGAARDLAG
jgi:hypothetical protein